MGGPAGQVLAGLPAWEVTQVAATGQLRAVSPEAGQCADTPASADAARPPRADLPRPAEPDHGRPAEPAPERPHSDAGRSRQPAHMLNRADYNAARHAEPPSGLA